MNTEQRLFWALVALFSVGVVLIAVGLGVTTKTASVAVGITLCLATTRFLAGGPKS